jgi:thioredoxin reductase
MAKSEANRRIAILGAGPVGIEAALYARKLNYRVTIYEKGRAGDYMRRWGFVRMFTPFGMNTTPLGRMVLDSKKLPADSDCLTGLEHVEAYVEPLAKSDLLAECFKFETQVVQVGRSGILKTESAGDNRRNNSPFRLLVRGGNTERIEEADIVFDCTGTYGRHRWLGDGGIPAAGEMGSEPHIMYWLDDVLGSRRQNYAGKSILLIGTGYSAATSACNLAALAEQHPETWTIWLSRDPRSQPMHRHPNDPLKERDRLAIRANSLATRGEGNLEFHAATVIDTIVWRGQEKGFHVTGRSAGKPKTWEVERVIANVGFTPDTDLYRELQVHECYASLGPMALAAALSKSDRDDCLAIGSMGASTLRNPEPSFYILGAKSYGRNPHFLLKTGFDQVREVFALVTGKPDLDLYKAVK